MGSNRTWAVVLSLGLLVAAAVQIRGVVDRVTVSSLDARPESFVIFPGSVLLRRGGHEANSESPAGNWQQFGSQASPGAIAAFYEAESSTRGFLPGGGSSSIPMTVELAVCAWHNEELVIRVSFWELDEFHERYPSDPSFPTIYDLRLIDVVLYSDPPVCNRELE